MAIRRRGFLRIALGVGGLLAAPFWRAVEWAAPPRYTEALRAKFYPGRLAPMDEKAVAKTGKWAG